MNKFERKMIEKMDEILAKASLNLGYCDDAVDDLDKTYKAFLIKLPHEPTEGWTFWRENGTVCTFDDKAAEHIKWILDFSSEVCLSCD